MLLLSLLFRLFISAVFSSVSLAASLYRCAWRTVKQMARARMTTRQQEGESGSGGKKRQDSKVGNSYLKTGKLRSSRCVAKKKHVNDLVVFSNGSWRAAIKILPAQSGNIRGWASSPVSSHEHPVMLISNPIRTWLWMQMQHYLQYRSNLLRGCLDEGRAVWTSLVKKKCGLTGGWCLCCLCISRWKLCMNISIIFYHWFHQEGKARHNNALQMVILSTPQAERGYQLAKDATFRLTSLDNWSAFIWLISKLCNQGG